MTLSPQKTSFFVDFMSKMWTLQIFVFSDLKNLILTFQKLLWFSNKCSWRTPKLKWIKMFDFFQEREFEIIFFSNVFKVWQPMFRAFTQSFLVTTSATCNCWIIKSLRANTHKTCQYNGCIYIGLDGSSELEYFNIYRGEQEPIQ